MKYTTLQISEQLLENNFSIIPILPDRSKPHGRWKQYQENPPSFEKIRIWFENGSSLGIGIIMGEASDYLYAFDFETREIFQKWESKVKKDPQIELLNVAVFRSAHGVHGFFRCQTKLAADKTLAMTKQPVEGHKPNKDGYTGLIELLKQGNYANFYPEKNKDSDVDQFFDLKLTSENTAKRLIEIAHSFDERPTEKAIRPPEPEEKGNDQPGSIFNHKANLDTMLTLLEKMEWEETHRDTNPPKIYVRRPNRDKEGHSAQIDYHIEANIPFFYNYTTNALPFEPNCGYFAFQVRTAVEYGSFSRENFRKCAKDIAREFDLDKEEEKEEETISLPGFQDLTDFTLTDQFLEESKEKLIYCPDKKKEMYAWNGFLWKLKNDNLIINKIKIYIQEKIKEINKTKNNKIRNKMLKEIQKIKSYHKINNVLSLIRGNSVHETSDFNKNRDLIQVGTKTFDLEKNEIMKPNPSNLITLSAVSYDSNAKRSRFDRFIQEIFEGNSEKIEYVQRLFGYCLLGENTKQIFIICIGDTNSGKSILLETIMSTFGDYGGTVSMSTFMAKNRSENNALYELAGLQHKRFVVGSEATSYGAFSEGIIKKISGGDSISCRHPYGSPMKYKAPYIVAISTNELPIVDASDDAVWGRFKIIHFKHSFEKSKENIPKKLEGEKSGILNWLIEGYRKWREDEDFHETDEDKIKKRELRSGMDPVEEFLRERTKDNPNGSVKKSELFFSYQEWLEINKIKDRMSKKKFGLRIKSFKKYKEHRDQYARYWIGLNFIGENSYNTGSNNDFYDDFKT